MVECTLEAQLEVSENDLAESLKIHFEKACNP